MKAVSRHLYGLPTEIASNKTQPLVGFTDNGGYMLGPTQIVCEGNTQVHSIRHLIVIFDYSIG